MMHRKISILLCAAMALALAGCGAQGGAQTKNPTVTVEVTAVQSGSLASESTYIGTISAEGTASVVSMVSGTVTSVPVHVGDRVTAGQTLCAFDDQSARLTLQNAQASYASAQQSYESAVSGYGGTDLSVLQEQLDMAQNNYDATLALLEMGAASQVEVDQAHQSLISAQAGLQSTQAALASAQAGVQSAQVGIASAEYQLSLYHLTSPISGVVEAIHVTENNFAASGNVAFVISNAENKTVTFYVTDEVRQILTLGQAVTVSSRGLSYTGIVSEVSGVVDAATGLFQVKALIDGAQDLPDGLTVELSTVSRQVDDAILVPCDALYFSDGEAYVYLMQDEKAVRTNVTVVLYTPDQAAVTAGLEPGAEVITTWGAGLKDGAPVRLASDADTAPES